MNRPLHANLMLKKRVTARLLVTTAVAGLFAFVIVASIVAISELLWAYLTNDIRFKHCIKITFCYKQRVFNVKSTLF